MNPAVWYRAFRYPLFYISGIGLLGYLAFRSGMELFFNGLDVWNLFFCALGNFGVAIYSIKLHGWIRMYLDWKHSTELPR